jgi:hypothetical protein
MRYTQGGRWVCILVDVTKIIEVEILVGCMKINLAPNATTRPTRFKASFSSSVSSHSPCSSEF